VYDSTWEAGEAYTLDNASQVEAWAKNDHLGFEVTYLFQGGVHRFRPDFLVRLANGTRLVLEVKGQDTPKDRAKRGYLAEWALAVNEHGGFGRWAADVSLSPSDLLDILARHGS
jgi:type III restriction enzyme